MATITPIEGRTVHQIQSGQVIVDLCSVVKELVENSLDAGATSIDVRFKNQGLESIEVQDNGDGISPHNYETIALKHHTSKLATYSDLSTLQTFGFRGEALSSLCALSNFTITTCMAADAPKGTKLEFEVSGKLKGTSVVAAQKGTMVSVENLFNNLPVRRRELERNIKREWSRVVGVLGQYACIQTGIKFTVTQQAGKGKKTVLFSTKGNRTTRENIVNVFGAKTLTALVPLGLNLELEPTSAPSQRWLTQEDGEKKNIRIVGHISRPASGEGRQTPDRQMFFVNGRPCGLPQVAKAFNEVYKSYNAAQSPFIFANIELDTHLYDVNVSPDKRTILLHDQTRMLDSLKEALTALFDSQDYTVPVSQLPTQKQPSYKQLTISRENASAAKAPTIQRATSVSSGGESSEDDTRGSKRRQNSEDDSTRDPKSHRSRATAAPQTSTGQDREAVTSISTWAERDVQERTEVEIQAPRAAGAVAGPSKGKQRLIEKLGKETEQSPADVPDDVSEDPESSVAASQSSDTPASYKLPIAVADFNQRIVELQTLESPAARTGIQNEPESPIPALPSPSKPVSSVSSRFSNSARSHRPPPQQATITIGDHTITSSIGTPCPKRPRIHDGPSMSHSAHLDHVKKGSVPTFGSRLTQRFAAAGAGAANPPSSDEDEIEDGGADVLQSPQSPVIPSPGSNEDNAMEETTQPDGEASDLVEEGLESAPLDSDAEEDEYIDDSEKKAREEAKVQKMIQAAEDTASMPSEANTMRAKTLLKGGSRKKDSTVSLVKPMNITVSGVEQQLRSLSQILSSYDESTAPNTETEALDSDNAEEKLSLTISKPDFAKMRVIGQFNLGFILATRASEKKQQGGAVRADDLFIIDQHASDEKYNFERLQSTTIVQSQRLVHPKTLDLTALEEEIVIENSKALETNGFIVTVDQSGDSPIGQRCQLVSLPLSRETTFSLQDLDELLALLTEHPSGSVPRPSKVRKMFAMRACRSSIMIGKTLTHKQMGNVVRHMGEIDRPWNCPHGRPTMRHLCGLGVWDELGWREGDEPDGGKGATTDWAAYIKSHREGSASESEPESS
ncbi:uncharacterized protein BP5553_06353 [Venustampulla echinocandica]|uniref:DNA mismatch repair protein PMS1 n=1 Tax=Venustampulla echinocandica TaxID=2656787 RepID=A0A370TJN8_9HELO|nr:uncharacterized protein BP5553_06353 [Venustampulla echinocandica]RDL35741.1 hypothetical protein BP5553_06353 [Venustampulla echinocandica]